MLEYFEFAYVNIFEDQEVFQNLPSFADWPTFPQIYMNSEYIMLEYFTLILLLDVVCTSALA
jgi:glutaredoxin-related protein